MPATVWWMVKAKVECSSQELRVYHANANCVARGNIDDDNLEETKYQHVVNRCRSNTKERRTRLHLAHSASGTGATICTKL